MRAASSPEVRSQEVASSASSSLQKLAALAGRGRRTRPGNDSAWHRESFEQICRHVECKGPLTATAAVPSIIIAAAVSSHAKPSCKLTNFSFTSLSCRLGMKAAKTLVQCG